MRLDILAMFGSIATMNKFYHERMGWIARRVARIKRLRGPHLLQFGEDGDPDRVIEFLKGMGYFVYENPGNADIGEFIVSDRTVTYGDCRRYYKRLGIDLDWWKETSFVDMPNEELQEA